MAKKNMHERLLKMSDEAFEAGWFETAYHLLCAATHHAKSLENEDYLQEVLRVAQAQHSVIDQNHPDSIFAKKNVTKRAGVDLFQSLFTQIEGDIKIIRIRQRKPPYSSTSES